MKSAFWSVSGVRFFKAARDTSRELVIDTKFVREIRNDKNEKFSLAENSLICFLGFPVCMG
jgi:hypothetical protein